MKFDHFAQRLNLHHTADLIRQPPVFERTDGRYLYSASQRWLDFASNDYLGFAHHPKVKQAWSDSSLGVGAGASALVTGTTRIHQQLSEQLAEVTGKSGVMLFSSGFSANQGALETLTGEQDLLIQDKLNHASLIDGGQHSSARFCRFRHNDMASLARQLQRPARQRWVVTEGVFSMDGDQPPFSLLQQVVQQHNAALILDDAHGFGVVGEHGLGSLSLAEVAAQQVDVYVLTFGKALGVAGAALCCKPPIFDYLQQFCRQHIYTTAMPMAQAAAVNAAIMLLRSEPQYHQQLRRNIDYLRTRMQEYGLPLMASDSAIQPILVGDNTKTMALAMQLRDRGFWVGAIRPPTVPQGLARLRITVSASHLFSDIDALAAALAAAWDSHG